MDVDALCDKDGNVVICGIMEHIEQAGIHSGDSACSIPTQVRGWATGRGAVLGTSGEGLLH